jgi:GntR family transcriptional repressor for pyruvate dehydrogenase complex
MGNLSYNLISRLTEYRIHVKLQIDKNYFHKAPQPYQVNKANVARFMNYKTIKRQSAADLVRNQILNSIESGELKPGDKLPTEHQLCQMFGVGRSTIRGAISTLSTLGYINSIQGKGSFVRESLHPEAATSVALRDIQSAANILDLMEVREILECSVVRLVARRADKEDLQRIQGALSKMKSANQEQGGFTEYDFEFHTELARSTGNQMIFSMMRQIVEKVHQEYKKFRPKEFFQRDQAVTTAEQVVECVFRGDGDGAAAAMRAHLALVTMEIKRKLPDVKWIKKRP